MLKGKNKHCYNDIEFDSNEEIEFYKWFEVAKQNGYVEKIIYQPESYILSDKKTLKYTTINKKTKAEIIKEKHLFQPHVYTADFIIYTTDKFENDFPKHNLKTTIEKEYVIDVKGDFQKFDGKRSFSINQKWVYDKHNIYVNKVIPFKFFKQTFCPSTCYYSKKNNKPYTRFKDCKVL